MGNLTFIFSNELHLDLLMNLLLLLYFLYQTLKEYIMISIKGYFYSIIMYFINDYDYYVSFPFYYLFLIKRKAYLIKYYHVYTLS
jgi:hypothetical protein